MVEVAPPREAGTVEREYDGQGFRIRGAQPTRMEAFVDAAFAFAVTLLVVSVGSMPHSVAELVDAMRGVPAFAASFVVITLIWQEHRQWSQRFGLEDGYTIRLSLALVFMVLLYVYPLRMMFALAIDGLSGGVLATHPLVTFDGVGDICALYVIFAIGYAVTALIIVQLNRYALRRADALALSARERVHTGTTAHIWLIIAGVALLSLVLALVLSVWAPSALTWGIPGDIYILIWPAAMIMSRRGRAKLAVLQQEQD
ncbi:MAG TPA: TMEM175 family protein [Rhodanobacteraceae bacterium]|nr:TMEM175 family protein [Rhodanobacteraceae bacterium]